MRQPNDFKLVTLSNLAPPPSKISHVISKNTLPPLLLFTFLQIKFYFSRAKSLFFIANSTKRSPQVQREYLCNLFISFKGSVQVEVELM